MGVGCYVCELLRTIPATEDDRETWFVAGWAGGSSSAYVAGPPALCQRHEAAILRAFSRIIEKKTQKAG